MNTADQKDRIDQDVAHRRLLSAVVALAIRDVCQIQSVGRLSENSRTGLNFIFEHSDGYLSLLDIDPEHFRRKLLEFVFKNFNSKEFIPAIGLSQIERRRFASNYKIWHSEKIRQRERIMMPSRRSRKVEEWSDE